jgi:AraC-like DNA-binding protein
MTELPPPHTALVLLDTPPVPVAIGIGVHGLGGHTDEFRLPDLWQFHLYGYEADLTVDDAAFTVRPGSVSLVPPGASVRYRYRGRSEHLYVHLRMASGGAVRSVPTVQHAGPERAALTAQLQQALAAWPHAPAVAAAVAAIEARLAEPLAVADIAKAAGVSHNHLTRLFRAATGETVVGYIRARRMERARHFLRATTLSIPAVAASVGIPDLQAFNKACRRELGASPRGVRAAQTVAVRPGGHRGEVTTTVFSASGEPCSPAP